MSNVPIAVFLVVVFFLRRSCKRVCLSTKPGIFIKYVHTNVGNKLEINWRTPHAVVDIIYVSKACSHE